MIIYDVFVCGVVHYHGPDFVEALRRYLDLVNYSKYPVVDLICTRLSEDFYESISEPEFDN